MSHTTPPPLQCYKSRKLLTQGWLISKKRYHIGESTLPSLRHFFKFIDFYDIFDAHGFFHKVRFHCNISQIVQEMIGTYLFVYCRTVPPSVSAKPSLMHVSTWVPQIYFHCSCYSKPLRRYRLSRSAWHKWICMELGSLRVGRFAVSTRRQVRCPYFWRDKGRCCPIRTVCHQ